MNYVFDKSRRLILHPDDKLLLTQVEPGKNRLLEVALSGFTGSGETVNSLGVPMLLSIRRVPVADWIVAVQVPRSEAYAPVARTRLLFFLVSGGAVLLVVIVGTVAIRRVVLPLRQLESTAVKIGTELAGVEEKGTFAADYILERLERYRATDEIGLLASAFSRLGTTLDQTLDSLRRAADDWQRTFDSVNDGVVILDSEGRILRMNRAAEDRFRMTGP